MRSYSVRAAKIWKVVAWLAKLIQSRSSHSIAAAADNSAARQSHWVNRVRLSAPR